MLIYVLLYLLIIFGSYAVYKISKEKNRKRNVAIFCSSMLVTLIAIRHPSMGIDLHYGEETGYIFSYHEISTFSWSKILSFESYLNYEKGYVIFNKILHTFLPHEQFLLIACALISLIPICVFLYKNSLSMRMSLIVYLALPTFVFVFSGLRQAIAIAICYIALKYAYDKKLIKFILLLSLAILFHKTSALFLIAYPLMNVKFKMFHRWLSLAVLALVFIFKSQIYTFATQLFGKIRVPDNNGSYMLFLLLVAIYVFCFIFTDKTRKNEGFLNLLFVACAIQAMGGVQNTVVRAAYYFMPVTAVLLPNVVMRMKNSFERKTMKACVITAFAVYGLFSICTTDWAMAVPYNFFWEVI